MLKKFIFLSLLFLMLAGIGRAEGDVANWSGSWGFVATDTVYIPSETRGLSTEDYVAWGFEAYIVTPDTVNTDTVCWVLEMSDTRQCSGTVVLATDTSVNDATIDTFSYWFRADTLSSALFPEQYWRLILYLWEQTTHADTLYPDSDFVMVNWSASDAGDSVYEAIDDILTSALDTTTAGGYYYAEAADVDHDSMIAVSVGNVNTGGYADSIVVFVTTSEEDAAGACSLEVAICHTDTGTCTVLDTITVGDDTLMVTMVSTTSPSSGEAWTGAEMADILLRFIPTAVAADDKLKVHRAGILVYYNSTYYFEAVEWKARAILKE